MTVVALAIAVPDPAATGAGAPTGARADFRRARRGHQAARRRGRRRGPLGALRGQPTRPRDLGDVDALAWQPSARRAIPLDAIVGTVDPTADFDGGFRPATDRVAARWQRIAEAHHEERPLPPIDVIERPDGYYVVDGRHRVSVARALGHDTIDAWTRPATGLGGAAA
jgi:ParB-like nuclease domain